MHQRSRISAEEKYLRERQRKTFLAGLGEIFTEHIVIKLTKIRTRDKVLKWQGKNDKYKELHRGQQLLLSSENSHLSSEEIEKGRVSKKIILPVEFFRSG